VLEEIVAENVPEAGARVHAFCWMTNHLHLLVQIADTPLAKLMQRVSMRYARYRHALLRTTGHLFEKRYGARHIQDDDYFLTVLRYIHRNPCAAGLAGEPAAYPWSSHADYLGLRTTSWVTTGFGLSLFHSGDISIARKAYAQFVDAPDEEREIEHDPLIPGADPAAATMPVEQILDSIARAVCHARLLNLDVVRGPGRNRCLSAARVEIARRALSGHLATLGEVARYLRRDPSVVCQLLARRRQ